ncbi:MAG: Crp/Fnr family transcriptional regulator [Bryobacteraceae bacterium]
MGLSVAEALRGLPFVEEMEPGQVDRLAAMAKELGYEKDQVIFREGDAQKRLFIVVSGKVALETTTAKGVFRVLTVEEGRELGWSSLVASTRSHFRARAQERVTVLAFEAADLEKACRDDPVFGCRLLRRLVRVVSDRLEAMRIHFVDLYNL